MSKDVLALVTLLLLCTITTMVHAQTGELTLRCDGKIIFDADEQKSVTSLGLIVNLTKKTVTGFVGVVANIYKTDDATISFAGEGPVAFSDNIPIGTNSVAGSIDQITGKVLVATTFTSDKTLSKSSWELSCVPTRRLFPYQSGGEIATVNCAKKLVDLSPRDAWQCILQSDEWEEISRNINDALERITNKTIGEWISSVEAIMEVSVIAALIVAPEFASYLFPFIFVKVLFQRLSGCYNLSLSGSEKRQWMFWSIYLLTTGAGMLLIARTNLFTLLQGGWECCVGVVIVVLGPKWWGIYTRLDSKSTISRSEKRTRTAAVIALGRYLDQLDISKTLSDR